MNNYVICGEMSGDPTAEYIDQTPQLSDINVRETVRGISFPRMT